MGAEAGDVAVEVIRTERRRLAAIVAGDTATVESIHADDYELVTPGGARLGRDDYLSSIADGTLRYRRFEPEGEIGGRQLGAEAAVLRYRVRMDVDWPGGTDAGDSFWHTDVYERRDGRWQVVLSHATRIRRQAT